jgi:hypothetical protein
MLLTNSLPRLKFSISHPVVTKPLRELDSDARVSLLVQIVGDEHDGDLRTPAQARFSF